MKTYTKAELNRKTVAELLVHYNELAEATDTDTVESFKNKAAAIEAILTVRDIHDNNVTPTTPVEVELLPETPPTTDTDESALARIPDLSVYTRMLGLSLPDDVTELEFFQVGVQLARMERGLNWAIGDWYNGMQWGDKMDACARVGLDYGMAKQYAYTAGKYTLEQRHEAVSFGHHAKIPALEPVQREELLVRVEEEGLTCADLSAIKRDMKGGVAKTPVQVLTPEDVEPATPDLDEAKLQLQEELRTIMVKYIMHQGLSADDVMGVIDLAIEDIAVYR